VRAPYEHGRHPTPVVSGTEKYPSQGSLQRVDPGGGHCQVGSLAGAAHLLKDNAGVLR